MPSQQNYETSISEKLNTYKKYTVSRIVQTAADTLVEMEVPANFPIELINSSIEIHIYSLADNRLVTSKVIKNDIVGVITKAELSYTEDETERQLLFIDFSKLTDTTFPLGLYSVTLNFFVDEIGSYDDKSLELTRISPTRYEVELELNNTEEQENLKRFFQPTITEEWILPITKQIFNQEIPEELQIPVSSTIFTPEFVLEYYPSGSGEKMRIYGFLEDGDGGKLGLNTVTQQILDIAYGYATASINADIARGTGSFAASKFMAYATSSIQQAYEIVRQDQIANPTKYRYDLI